MCYSYTVTFIQMTVNSLFSPHLQEVNFYLTLKFTDLLGFWTFDGQNWTKIPRKSNSLTLKVTCITTGDLPVADFAFVFMVCNYPCKRDVQAQSNFLRTVGTKNNFLKKLWSELRSLVDFYQIIITNKIFYNHN